MEVHSYRDKHSGIHPSPKRMTSCHDTQNRNVGRGGRDEYQVGQHSTSSQDKCMVTSRTQKPHPVTSSSGTAPDHLIRSRQRAEATHQSNQAQKAYYERTALVARFADQAQVSIRQRTVPRRVTAWREADAIVTEQRRQRLREVLDQDTAGWRCQLLAMDITPQSRVEEMRVRVSELKSKREQERLRIVQEKVEQQKRLNCDELRAVKSRVMTQAVTEVRAKQIREQTERKQQEQVENEQYAKAWEQLRQDKVNREDQDEHRRRTANAEQTRILTEQIQQLHVVRQQEQQAAHAYEQAQQQERQIIQMQEEYVAHQRAYEAKQTRIALEVDNQTNRIQRQHDMQRELQRDGEWINQLMQLDQLDKQHQSAAKKALQEDLVSYRQTVLQHRHWQSVQDDQMNRMYMVDNERMWQTRLHKWTAEQAKRQQLMHDVMQTRREQCQVKVLQAQHQLREKQRELRQVQEVVHQMHHQDVRSRHAALLKKQEYHAVLREQVADKHARLLVQRDHELAHLHDQRISDQQYQEWLQRELDRTRLQESVPGRDGGGAV